MENFTPITSLIGGALIGLSAAVLMLMNGKIAGISGIVGGLLDPPSKGDAGWRIAFLLGLLATGAIAATVAPAMVTSTVSRSSGAIVAAGLLVGLGTRLGNGCTSGHGVCGLSRFSGRSLVATLVFMLTGGIAVFVGQHVLGGTL